MDFNPANYRFGWMPQFEGNVTHNPWYRCNHPVALLISCSFLTYFLTSLNIYTMTMLFILLIYRNSTGLLCNIPLFFSFDLLWVELCLPWRHTEIHSTVPWNVDLHYNVTRVLIKRGPCEKTDRGRRPGEDIEREEAVWRDRGRRLCEETDRGWKLWEETNTGRKSCEDGRL
jgi:hypothetical protein